jgi:hypothetical protein
MQDLFGAAHRIVGHITQELLSYTSNALLLRYRTLHNTVTDTSKLLMWQPYNLALIFLGLCCGFM